MKFSQFLIKQYRSQIIVAVGVFFGIIVLAYYKMAAHQMLSWLDPITGSATLVFALFLWLNGLRKEWEEELPKRLTVQYEYEGRNVMVCYDSLLTNLADARTWALQIGKQMSDCEKLRFAPFYNFQDRGILTNKKGNQYKSYVLTYYLTQLPIPANGTEKSKKDFVWKLQNGCIEWYPEYNADNTISISEGFIVKSGAKMTVTE